MGKASRRQRRALCRTPLNCMRVGVDRMQQPRTQLTWTPLGRLNAVTDNKSVLILSRGLMLMRAVHGSSSPKPESKTRLISCVLCRP